MKWSGKRVHRIRRRSWGIRDETIKERSMKIYKHEKCIYQSKKGVNEQFGRKMNQKKVKGEKLQ